MMTEDEKSEYKKLYNKLKSKGICPRCGKYKAAPDRVHCLNCLDAFAVSQMKRRDNRTEEEKQKENEAQSARSKKRYKERKEQGLCVQCGKKSRPGKAMCLKCAKKDYERHAIKRDNKRR